MSFASALIALAVMVLAVLALVGVVLLALREPKDDGKPGKPGVWDKHPLMGRGEQPQASWQPEATRAITKAQRRS